MTKLSEQLDRLTADLSVPRQLDGEALYAKARVIRRRRRGLAMGAGALTVGLLLGLGSVSMSVVQDQRTARTQTASVPPLPADASPEEVVRRYLEAVDAHDVDTARSLVVPEKWDHIRWNVRDWTDLVRSDVGQAAPADADMAVPTGWALASVRLVPVKLEVKKRRDLPFWPRDNTVDVLLGKSWGPWGYAVVRDPASGRYLIFDQGEYLCDEQTCPGAPGDRPAWVK